MISNNEPEVDFALTNVTAKRRANKSSKSTTTYPPALSEAFSRERRLTLLPIDVHGLQKSAFRDALSLWYGWLLQNPPSHRTCLTIQQLLMMEPILMLPCMVFGEGDSRRHL